MVGCSVRRHVLRTRRTALATPTAGAADEHRRAERVQRFAVHRRRRRRVDTAALPLSNMPVISPVSVDRALDRDRTMQRDRLLAVDELGRVEATDVAHRRARAPADHDRERREHQLVDAVRVLGGELEFFVPCADTRPHTAVRRGCPMSRRRARRWNRLHQDSGPCQHGRPHAGRPAIRDPTALGTHPGRTSDDLRSSRTVTC